MDIANNEHTVPAVYRSVDEVIGQIPEPRRQTAPYSQPISLGQKKDIGNSIHIDQSVYRTVSDMIEPDLPPVENNKSTSLSQKYVSDIANND